MTEVLHSLSKLNYHDANPKYQLLNFTALTIRWAIQSKFTIIQCR